MDYDVPRHRKSLTAAGARPRPPGGARQGGHVVHVLPGGADSRHEVLRFLHELFQLFWIP